MSHRPPRPVHVRQSEADVLGAKLTYQIRSGQLHEALGSLRFFIASKKAGHSEFAEYASFEDLPLGLAVDLSPKDLRFCERAGLHTAGDVGRLSDASLIAMRGMSQTRVKAIRAAIAALKREWKAFKRLHAEREGGGSNSL